MQKRIKGAEKNYQEALVRATGCSMKPLVARCHHALGEVYRQSGRKKEAAQALRTAQKGYDELQLAVFSAQAQAALDQVISWRPVL